jgi:hypothetical protein
VHRNRERQREQNHGRRGDEHDRADKPAPHGRSRR